MDIKSMKSHELRAIKPIAKNKKKILLINPKKENAFFSISHNGLAMLAAIIKKAGHEVLVIDYLFIRGEQKSVAYFIDTFKPDIIGVSMYTNNARECDNIIRSIRKISNEVPIIVGGPHATLYHNILKNNKNIDYIFRGEAELTILNAIKSAKRQKNAQIVETKEMLDLNDLPYPDFKAFYRWEDIRGYPIMTSRGCPNLCTFCAVRPLAFRMWRARAPEECIKELEYAKQNLFSHLVVNVLDDNPTVNKERFKQFLRLYSKKIRNQLIIINTRADGIDEEMAYLIKKANCNQIFLGVEHANLEMFKSVDKGETLGQIEAAAKLIKKYKIALGLSFIIGLPGDTLYKIKDSIKFAQKSKADICSINMITPYESTKVREYFIKRNISFDEINYNPQVEGDFICEEPLFGTPEFTIEERKKAYYMFIFRTVNHRLKILKILKIFSIASQYGLYSDFFYWLPRGIIKDLYRFIQLSKTALYIFRREGIGSLIFRIRNRNR